MDTKISSLSDYATLKKLASALWKQDNSYHGAAIMVGAGFSRSAASTGDINRKLPLWYHFSETLAKELGSRSTDSLRLAEEYSAYFGKQALHDLIKKEINDAAWTPGELYKSLLELPWTEVLTTNWDTLLERASTEVHHPVYNVVSKQEDLSSARSPRIVKLHGTIDITKDLIFTQEDYRKYPQHHAAFVNFSRQVFIENELCLLGFSGDDPNFLQWAGWVRDNLATHSRRIYLVGALDLPPAKRKYLESINVSPIDIGDLVSDYDEPDIKHLQATKLFVQALQDLKPTQVWEWKPKQLPHTSSTEDRIKRNQDSAYAAKLLEEQLPILKEDRLSYPGWLVCPQNTRWELQNQIHSPWPTPKNLSHMAPDSCARLLYEITWRHEKTYGVISSELSQELLTVCDPDKSCTLTKKQQLEVALILLKNTRWKDTPENESIANITKSILEKGVKYWPECTNELAYHYAIMARDTFNYSTLEKYAEKITNSDSIWKLRKASLFAEIGKFEKGEKLVAEAHRELLGQYRNDRNSIHILSRLSWAKLLIRGIETWSKNKELKVFPSSYQEVKCNPWDHIEYIRQQVTKALDDQQKQMAIEPLFEPGFYKDNSNRVSFSNELNPLLIMEGISYTVGVPVRWNNINFLVEQAARLTELEEIDNTHRFALAIRSASSDTSDVLKKVFSRIKVACFPQEDVDFLLDKCMLAIDYWADKKIKEDKDTGKYAIDRLAVFIEVLARVSIRATPKQAKKIFGLGASLVQQPKFPHLWLSDALRRLTESALESIPQPQHSDVLLEALSFPLITELNGSNHNRWVNVVIKHPGKREQDSRLDRRIDEIIDSVSPYSSQSTPALLRLLPLIENNFLSDKELKKISEKVWGVDPDYKALPETGLFMHALLKIPSQNPVSVKALVRDYLFESKENNLFNQELLASIANAAQSENMKEVPSKDQAIEYFKKLIIWRAQQYNNDILGFSRQKEQQTAKLIAEVLARSVVPMLPLTEFTEDNFQKLYTFYDEVDTPAVLIALTYFAAANENLTEKVEKMLRQGFLSKNANKVAYTSYALLAWRDMNESPIVERLILRLISLIGWNRMIGQQALLWTANQMYCKDYLSPENIESLVEILPVIFDNTAYCDITPSSRESVSVSLVRAACVRLARDILSKSQNNNGELLRIQEEAMHDSLPEVRFAMY
ncbi:SIR2 family NAD-dependent protein deacylase [Serratia fonticola]|uniref:SIR2 family NAD-dependent protein deacylase n=1 Tax=Serratia fonticola TaxID=47917 RepID=UPI0024DE1799|nr:SIR2 family protein [Serratia fonticola]MDK2374097.1 SIR2 family protein [Serratia fonticola]